MHDLGGLDLPQGRSVGILLAGFAWAVDAAAKHSLVAARAQPGGGGEAAAVAEENANFLDKSLAQITRELDVLGEHHMTARLQ